MKDLTEFLEKIEKLGIKFSVADGNLKINAAKGVMTKALIGEFKIHKEAIIALFDTANDDVITKTPEQPDYPASHDQQRIWSLSQDEIGNKAYTLPIILTISGKLNIDVLETAIQLSIQRHEILRTTFKTNVQNELRQVILPYENLDFKVAYKDISNLPNAEEVLDVEIHNTLQQTFDFDKLLFRVFLTKIAEQEFVLFIHAHHIIIDGWSYEVLTHEVMETYEALLTGNAEKLPELSLQYKDFAVWQSETFKTAKWQGKKEYWLRTFSGEIPVIEIPAFKKRPLHKTYAGSNVTSAISEKVTTTLKNYAHQNGLSLFTVLMAGLNGLLYRYTNQKDIIIGIPISTRFNKELENQVGLFMNTIAIRTKFQENNKVVDLIDNVKGSLLNGYDNGDYPFDMWLDALQLKTAKNRSTLFDVMAVFQDSVKADASTSSLQIQRYAGLKKTTSKFDLLFEFFDNGDQITVSADYNVDIYDGKFVETLVQHLELLLQKMMETPTASIDSLDFVVASEKEVIEQFNDTDTNYPKDKTIVDLFEEQVVKTPNKTALVYENESLTYQEVENWSNQFANYILTQYDIQSEDLIAVTQEKSSFIIPILLGILKTGAAYVPIDSNYPEKRQEYLKEITQYKLNITDAFLADFLEEQKEISTKKPEIKILPSQLFHIMFTSGTTGNPKGVMLEHENIVQFATSIDYLTYNEETVLLSTVSISFDTTNMEFWTVLVNGGTVVLAKRTDLFNYDLFKTIIENNKVNTMWLTASWFQHVAENRPDLFSNLKQFVSGGDIVTPKHMNMLRESYPNLKLVNGYGPTETTTFSTTYSIKEKQELAIPIGKPIANTQVHILNEELIPQPIGVKGTLYISGKGVARGYFNNSELTQEKFIENPFEAGTRMYNTGDAARWLPDGTIEFFGRKDHLEKIRGKFIDTTEIANTLCMLPNINQAVAIVHTDAHQEKKIVAYLVTNEALDTQLIKQELRKILADFMIPQVYIEIPEIPLSHNGKVDRKALPNPEMATVTSSKTTREATPTETKLIQIWKEILKVDDISILDDFFDLGGYSLNSITLLATIEKTFKKKITLANLFENSILSDLATYIDTVEVTQQSHQQIEALTLEKYPLSFAQQRMWIKNYMHPEDISDTVASVYCFEGNIKKDHIQHIFEAIIERHEILRSIFPFEDGEATQKVLTLAEAKAIIFKEEKAANINETELAVTNSGFVLTEQPPIRIECKIVNDQKFYIKIQLHHIAYDAWTIKLLSEEFGHYLSTDKSLPPLSIQYKHYAHWQNNMLNDENAAESLRYWKNRLQNLANIPVRKNSGKVMPELQTLTLDTEATSEIKDFCKKENVEDIYVLLSAFAIAYADVFQQEEIICNVPYLGRQHPQLQDVIGLFYQILILNINTKNEQQTLAEHIVTLQNQVHESIQYLDYPFEKLLDEIEGLRAHNNAISFNMISEQIMDLEASVMNTRDFSIKPIPIPITENRLRTDITFDIISGDQYVLYCTYDSSKYANNAMEQLLSHMKLILKEITKNSTRSVNEAFKHSVN